VRVTSTLVEMCSQPDTLKALRGVSPKLVDDLPADMQNLLDVATQARAHNEL
jgi:hypothetical protein